MKIETEHYNYLGKHHSTLIEQDDGRVITQIMIYEPEAQHTVTSQPGTIKINVSLKVADIRDIETLIDSWRAHANRPGFHGHGTEQELRDFLIETRGWGTLWASTSRA